MQFPTVESVIDMHQEILRRTGGTPGILNLGAIDSALYRAQWGPFFGEPDLATRAALLLRGLCQDHPFADGNKRTSYEITCLFLERNDFLILARAEDFVDFMVAVARDQMDLRAIADWLRARKGELHRR